MFCFDVCKLYPSVPKPEGLEACIKVLKSRSTSITPTEEVSKMIVVLNNNNLNLGNKHYMYINKWAEYKPYMKSTDKQLYLQKTSKQPPSTKSDLSYEN